MQNAISFATYTCCFPHLVELTVRSVPGILSSSTVPTWDTVRFVTQRHLLKCSWLNTYDTELLVTGSLGDAADLPQFNPDIIFQELELLLTISSSDFDTDDLDDDLDEESSDGWSSLLGSHW